MYLTFYVTLHCYPNVLYLRWYILKDLNSFLLRTDYIVNLIMHEILKVNLLGSLKIQIIHTFRMFLVLIARSLVFQTTLELSEFKLSFTEFPGRISVNEEFSSVYSVTRLPALLMSRTDSLYKRHSPRHGLLVLLIV